MPNLWRVGNPAVYEGLLVEIEAINGLYADLRDESNHLHKQVLISGLKPVSAFARQSRPSVSSEENLGLEEVEELMTTPIASPNEGEETEAPVTDTNTVESWPCRFCGKTEGTNGPLDTKQKQAMHERFCGQNPDRIPHTGGRRKKAASVDSATDASSAENAQIKLNEWKMSGRYTEDDVDAAYQRGYAAGLANGKYAGYREAVLQILPAGIRLSIGPS